VKFASPSPPKINQPCEGTTTFPAQAVASSKSEILNRKVFVTISKKNQILLGTKKSKLCHTPVTLKTIILAQRETD
jgi:hypothetical protein